MNWIIVILIAFIMTIIIFTTCGVGGGMVMLVALNGFSESEAMPILFFFTLLVLGISITLATAASWIFIKARRAESKIRFWHVAGISNGVNILIILIIFAVIAIMRL